jgi:hypothetical protein
MRESADQPQRVLNQMTADLSRYDLEGDGWDTGNGHEGEMITVDDEIDVSEIPDPGSHSPRSLARQIDTEAMDLLYSSLRKSSDRINKGYNRMEGLRAVSEQIDAGMVTGAKPDTIQDWYDDFREAGLTYPDGTGERLTSEGEIFVEELDSTARSLGLDQDEADEYFADLFGSLSRRGDNQGDKLKGFLMMADTDRSVTDIAVDVGTTRRTAYNWINEWIDGDGPKLFRGEPGDRELTHQGREAYDLVDTQYSRLDIASQMKAEMIQQMDADAGEIHVPGSRSLISSYLPEDESIQAYRSEDSAV